MLGYKAIIERVGMWMLEWLMSGIIFGGAGVG